MTLEAQALADDIIPPSDQIMEPTTLTLLILPPDPDAIDDVEYGRARWVELLLEIADGKP
jgi:hypothetical protein